MRYEALGQSWEIAFPFRVQRALEERYDKGFFGICKMIAPAMSGDVDFNNPAGVLDVIGEVRVGVLVDMIEAGTEGMTAEQAVKAYEEMGLVPAFSLIFQAINPGVEEDAPRPTVTKKKTPTKKRAG